MKRLLVLAVVSAVFVLGCSEETPLGTQTPGDASQGVVVSDAADQPEHRAHKTRTYEIVLENLTPATGMGASQPLSPPVLATHRRAVRVFRVGRFASDELIQVAEDAINAPLVTKLNDSRHVYEVVQGGGVVLPGESATYEITAKGSKRFLSLVSMLVNTNDGFTGTSGLRLPLFGSRSYYLNAYDAGSEENTESADHIPGPCCMSPGVGPDEHRRIRHHEGILGIGDLDAATYGWNDPVAKLTITSID